jgi:single-stranded-DNA-specific exonuclease
MACSRRRWIGCTPTASGSSISVDCGIRGVEAALHARALGLDLIITDHHEPDPSCRTRSRSSIPNATTARIRTRTLAGVGVALKLVQALCTKPADARGCRRS